MALPYKKSEAKAWAREHMKGVTNVIMPSFTADLRALNEKAIRFDVRRCIELGFWGSLVVSECSTTKDEYKRFLEIVIDDTAGTVLDATIPGGAFSNPPDKGWKVNGLGTKWTYSDLSTSRIGGISQVVIQNKSASTPGLVTFTVTGKKGSYAVASTALPVTAHIRFAASGQECGDAAFSSCTFNKPGSTLKCK